MNPFLAVWEGLQGLIRGGLHWFHDVAFLPVFGEHAWGWSIIALTLVIRTLLLPLAVKQFRSMRGMQDLQPQIRAIQKRHKVDRELLKRDPAAYREKRQKMNEEIMALYKERGVNPAAGCLPLILQAPVFFALFWTLRDDPFLKNAPFYVFRDLNPDTPEFAQGLGALVSQAGVWGILLVLLMGATMFITQKQMMGRTRAEGIQAQQQKVLLYAMPVFLAFISFQLPIGVLLYWVTQNFWQLIQQGIMLREVEAKAAAEAERLDEEARELPRGRRGKQQRDTARPREATKPRPAGGKRPPPRPADDPAPSTPEEPPARRAERDVGAERRTRPDGHLPRRRGPRGG